MADPLDPLDPLDPQGSQRLSSRYASLGHEEPPPELDAAILSAARRAAEVRPAPLVAPTGRRRWYFPVAAAAVIVLSVAVTTQVEREQPDPEAAIPAQAKEQTERDGEVKQEIAKPVPEQRLPERARSDAPTAKASPQAPREEALRRTAPDSAASSVQDKVEPQRTTPSAPAAASPAPAARGQVQPEMRAKGLASKVELPDEWLERIARLREERRDEEADRAFEDFKRRYPEFKIPEAMLWRLAKRQAAPDK